MEITIIGTGNMARGIATRLLAGGARGYAGSARPARRRSTLAGELWGDVRAAGDRRPSAEATSSCWRSPTRRRRSARPYEGQLDGKVVVDITNPVDFSPSPRSTRGRVRRPGGRGQGPGAQVVKAFNTTFAGTLLDGKGHRRPADVLHRRRRRGRQGGGRRASRRRRPTRRGRRAARASGGAGVARLPAYGAAGSAGHRLRQRRQVHRVTDSMATDTLAQVATLRSVPVAPSGPPPPTRSAARYVRLTRAAP